MPDKNKSSQIIEYILGIAGVVVLFVFVSIKMSTELHDPDIWLHLKTGEYIVQHKTVPHNDIFSSTLSGKEWIDHSWLVQVIFYLVFHFWGPDTLILLSSITVVLAFLFLFFTIDERYQRSALVISLLFLTIWASQIRYNIRPENFSILFFSIYLLLLTKLSKKNWIFLLPLIQLIWVNCHGFFVLGPLLVGIFILGESLKRSNLLPWEWGKVMPLDKKSFRNLIVVFLLTCLVSFINPYGYKGALYPFGVIFNPNSKSEIFYKHIIELLPTWEFTRKFNVDLSAYFILAALSFVSFLINFRIINIAFFAIWLVLFAVSVSINRNLLFFNFIAFLTTTDNLFRRFNNSKFNFIDKSFKKTKIFINNIVIILVILKTTDAGLTLLNRAYYIFEENRVKSSFLGIAIGAFPDKAVDFILANNLPDNIFNMFNYGSFLIYRAFPKHKVFIDGRTEIYGADFFNNYQKMLDGDSETIKDAFRKYNINTVLLSDIGGEKIDLLTRYFFNNPDWALIYFDKDSFVFLRDVPTNKALINKLKVDLGKWQTPKIDLDKIGLRNTFPEPYLKRAWKFYRLGLYEQATGEAKEALRVFPDASEGYNIIGLIYLKQKMYDLAFENLRLAYIYSRNSEEALKGLGDLYVATNKLKPAVSTFKLLNKLKPYSPESCYLLGKVYAQSNESRLAIASYKQAIKLSPYSDSSYKELSKLLYKNKDYKEAAAICKDAIKMGLDYRYFYKHLSIVHKKICTKPAQFK